MLPGWECQARSMSPEGHCGVFSPCLVPQNGPRPAKMMRATQNLGSTFCMRDPQQLPAHILACGTKAGDSWCLLGPALQPLDTMPPSALAMSPLSASPPHCQHRGHRTRGNALGASLSNSNCSHRDLWSSPPPALLELRIHANAHQSSQVGSCSPRTRVDYADCCLLGDTGHVDLTMKLGRAGLGMVGVASD